MDAPGLHEEGETGVFPQTQTPEGVALPTQAFITLAERKPEGLEDLCLHRVDLPYCLVVWVEPLIQHHLLTRHTQLSIAASDGVLSDH